MLVLNAPSATTGAWPAAESTSILNARRLPRTASWRSSTTQTRWRTAPSSSSTTRPISSVSARASNRQLGSTCYSQFTTEVDNPIDLTAPVETRRIPLKPEQQAALVELRPGVFVCPGGQYDLDGDGEGDFMISDSTDSTHYQIGASAQQDVQLTPR